MVNNLTDHDKEMALFAEWNPAPVIRLDESLKVVAANPAAEKLFHQLIECGCAIEKHIPDIDSAALIKNMVEGSIGYQTVTIDARTYQFMVRASSEDGIIQLYGSDISDLVTTRRDLQEALAERDTILSSLAVGISHVKDFHIDKVNRRWQEIFGYDSEEEVRGKSIEILFPKGAVPSEEMRNKVRRTLMNGEIFEYETHYERKDGSLFWGRLQSRAIDPHDFSLGAIITVEDFSARKKNEDELRQAKITAEDATKLKDKFVGLVTHDLRSPLATITGLLKTLDSQGEGLNEMQKEVVTRTIASADGSLKLIESLLDISRLQTGAMTPQRRMLDLTSLATSCIDGFRHLAAQKEVQLVNEVPRNIKVYADLNLFGEVLHNLMANAIKFTHQGDRITLYVPSSGATIALQDSGVGIDLQMLPDLFRSEIKTTSNGTSGERGTGLGLPLCREIMEAHGGSLRVESEVGEGTTFYVTLPVRKPRLLLVDNDPAGRALFREALGSLAVEFQEVADADTALAEVAASPPHMVIADAYLGEKEVKGFDLLEKLKSNPATMAIPVVLVTKPECAWSREKAFALQADDIVTKPLDEADFLPRIKRFIDQTQSVSIL